MKALTRGNTTLNSVEIILLPIIPIREEKDGLKVLIRLSQKWSQCLRPEGMAMEGYKGKGRGELARNDPREQGSPSHQHYSHQK